MDVIFASALIACGAVAVLLLCTATFSASSGFDLCLFCFGINSARSATDRTRFIGRSASGPCASLSLYSLSVTTESLLRDAADGVVCCAPVVGYASLISELRYVAILTPIF